jgi:hypothetical protein
MSCVKKLDDELQKLLYELEELMVPGILQKFCQLVGAQGSHSNEFMKVKQLWAAQMTLDWAKEQLELDKLADSMQLVRIKTNQ